MPKYYETRERKDEEWEERQAERDARDAKAPKYGSMTEDDSESSDGFEADGEDDGDIESDDVYGSSEGNGDGEIVYDDDHLKRRFAYELANPKIFSRTMNEGEPIRLSVSVRAYYADDDEDGNGDSDSSGTSPAPSDNEDSERGGDGGQDDLW